MGSLGRRISTTPALGGTLQTIAGSEFEDEFLPVIDETELPSSVIRMPRWFVLRYSTQGERTLLRVLQHVGMPHQVFTFTHREPGKEPTTRRWFPGYLFLNFCLAWDRWQQVNRMPFALELMGSPTPLPLSGEQSFPGLCLFIDELNEALIPRKARPASPIKPGAEVRVRSGVYKEWTGMVASSHGKRVTVLLMMFGGPRPVEMATKDVEIIG